VPENPAERPRHELDESAEELSLRLWELRELLDELVYHQEVQRLLLAAGSVKYLPRVTAEVDGVVERVIALDARRAEASSRLTALIELADDASLEEIAERVGGSPASSLRSHLAALRVLHSEVAALQQVNVEMSYRGAQAARDVLDALGGAVVETYTPKGSPDRLTVQPNRLDRTL
jgi:hypothetical protein